MKRRVLKGEIEKLLTEVQEIIEIAKEEVEARVKTVLKKAESKEIRKYALGEVLEDLKHSEETIKYVRDGLDEMR